MKALEIEFARAERRQRQTERDIAALRQSHPLTTAIRHDFLAAAIHKLGAPTVRNAARRARKNPDRFHRIVSQLLSRGE